MGTGTRVAIGALALTVLSALPMAAPAMAQVKVRFALDWILQGPQSTFLRAADSGCFAKEKLDVTIDRGFGSGDTVAKVATGNYDMGFSDMSVMMEFNAKSSGPKALAVFVLHDASSAAILTLKSTGITAPKDLIGKKLASPTGDASRRLFPVLAKAAGFDPAAVNWQNISPELREPMLARHEVDGISGLTYTGIMSLRALGVPADQIVTLKYADYGADLYGHAIMVNPAFAAAHPAAVTSVIKCTAEAMREALKDPAPSIAALKKRDALVNEAIETERLKLSIACCWVTPNTRAHGFSAIPEARLKNSIATVAAAFGFEPIPPAEIYTAKYLPPPDDLKLGL
ncbi:MAG TPA: ABC transporter substrate-binding protein [Candidatus Sulfotelmatobacter sp.]|nr:ABC transporter substrate-binding protein [Candidatus Sulfotelmatobacter sp.]